MNTQSNAVPESPLDAQPIAQAVSATRPMYWSIRRELWENRSIYIAPLAAAVVYFLGYLISLIWVPPSIRAMGMAHSTPQIVALAMPYSHAGMLLMVTAFLVGIFYSLEALHGERRDRSILFWKSLPVSDRTTVFAKAGVSLLILPVLVFVITVTLQILMRLLSSAATVLSGGSVATLWAQLPLFQMQLVLLYTVIVLALWHAPLYMWFLLVSGSVRRAAFLWAVLPPLAIAAAEYIAFHTHYFGSMLVDRLFGFAAAFDLVDKNGVPVDPHFIPLEQLAPGKFLGSPSLWLGLAFAAICLAAAVRLRRYQGPI
jgi:ABC-2 type transport system permease protein